MTAMAVDPLWVWTTGVIIVATVMWWRGSRRNGEENTRSQLRPKTANARQQRQQQRGAEEGLVSDAAELTPRQAAAEAARSRAAAAAAAAAAAVAATSAAATSAAASGGGGSGNNSNGRGTVTTTATTTAAVAGAGTSAAVAETATAASRQTTEETSAQKNKEQKPKAKANAKTKAKVKEEGEGEEEEKKTAQVSKVCSGKADTLAHNLPLEQGALPAAPEPFLPAPTTAPAVTERRVAVDVVGVMPGTATEAPETRPLRTLDELLNWQVDQNPYNIASVPLRPRAPRPGPQLLVCHDMMGGYVAEQDRAPQGNGGCSGMNTTSEGDGGGGGGGDSRLEDSSSSPLSPPSPPPLYRIFQWHKIDTFVYFSHNLVTIPPPGWTNAAHRAGVPVFGTFITEWDEGARVCAELLRDDTTADTAAEALARMAAQLGFDGWLVNIENNVAPECVPRLRRFVRRLRDACRTTLARTHMEQQQQLRPSPTLTPHVIWYDSVTVHGQLGWQNEVTALNRPWLDDADGIFLNYHWNEAHLARTCASLPRGLHPRVYAGIDVFGRGTFGGGGMETRVGLKAIADAGLSAAIFAPGWVYENQDKAVFEANQRAFWDSLRWPAHRVAGLPIATTFNRGAGRALYVGGACARAQPWSQLSAQSLLPTCSAGSRDNPYFPGPGMSAAFSDLHVAWSYEQAWDGGSSLELAGGVAGRVGDRCVLRLFETDFVLPPALCVCAHLNCDQLAFLAPSLVLVFESGQERYLHLDLIDSGGGGGGGGRSTQVASKTNDDEELPIDRNLRVKYGLARTPARALRCMPVDQQAYGASALPAHAGMGWYSAHHVVAEQSLRRRRVVEVRLSLQVTQPAAKSRAFKFLLGGMALFRPGDLGDVAPGAAVVSDLRCTGGVSWTRQSTVVRNNHENKSSGSCDGVDGLAVSLTLSWEALVGVATKRPAAYYRIYAEATGALIGTAHAPIFRVTRHAVMPNSGRAGFVVVPVMDTGLAPSLGESACTRIRWPATAALDATTS